MSAVVIAAAGFGLGVVAGAVEFVVGGRAAADHLPGTSAWGVHVVLTVVVVAWLAAARRSPRPRPPMPLSADFVRRVRAAYRHPARAVAVTLLLLLSWYLLWRMGEQVVGGLDPGFTVNAWGGPGYVGALYCHYLDCMIMIAAALLVIDLLIPGRSTSRRASLETSEAG